MYTDPSQHIYPLHPEIGNKNRFQQIMADGYTWIKKRLPSYGGANQFVFDSLALAESTPIGPGVRQRMFWQTTGPQLAMTGIFAPTAGLGGVVQGQFLSQPLYDPNNNTYGNIQGQ